MTAKRYLSQAYYLDARINARVDEIARLRAHINRCVSHISDMPRGGHVDWTDTAVRVMELENVLTAEVNELTRLEREIAAVIAAVQDDRYRTLLELRYRSFYSWEAIAVMMHYSYDHIIRMHGEALRAVKLPSPDEGGGDDGGQGQGGQDKQDAGDRLDHGGGRYPPQGVADV